jgi:hypothetical protein
MRWRTPGYAIPLKQLAYAEALVRESGQRIDPAKLIAPMLARFMATDRGFAKARRNNHSPTADEGEG